MPENVTISRYLDLEPDAGRLSEIDRIFFESSNTRSFDSAGAKAAFRERWLGRYLTHDPSLAYLARTENGAIVGYLVGAIEDPARAARFSDIAYFAELAQHTKRYPAHLHVNVGAEHRGAGIGSRLVERFAEDAKAAGAPGVHVVTSAGSPNVSFYSRNGFTEIARAGRDGTLVFLARPL
jgi:ribosomal protein S18 acetylase RimI-like enzyme